MKRIIVILTISSLLVASCSPFSKEAYLEEYKVFISEINSNSSNYTSDDWKKAAEKYQKLNNEWYNKFKDELTWDEKITIAGYKIQYNLIKTGSDIVNIYDSYLKKDIEAIQQKMEYYIENELDADLNKLMEEAKRTSEEFYKELQIMRTDIEKKLRTQ